jgi:peptide/nickel transport system permease protein
MEDAVIRFLLRRVLTIAAIMWGVGTSAFTLTFALGDPIRVNLGPRASPQAIREMRREYLLDRPRTVQYFHYMSRVARGDLGTSIRYHRPVTSLIAERFPRTLLLAAMAITFEVVFGVLLGTIAAARRGTRLDTAIMGSSFVLMSTPTFLSGKMLLMGLAYYVGWFPIGGYGTSFPDHVYHAVLPAIALGLLSMAFYARLARNELLDVLRSDYVRTARAKGLGGATVVVKHALRNAMMPIVTSLGLSFGSLFTGAIVTEAIFAWPGMGRLAIDAIQGLDMFVITGCVIFGAFGIQLGNLLADVAYAVLDPRIRVGGSASEK